jgi:hypothetical protein
MARLRLAPLAVLAACLPLSAFAQTVLHEQLPASPLTTIAPFANVNESHSMQMIADNFPVLEDAVVSAVEWWGTSVDNNTGLEVADLNLSGFRIQFFAADGLSTTGDAGMPGTLLAQEDIDISVIVKTPGDAGPYTGGPTLRFTAPLTTPVALQGGDTYWVAINAIVSDPAQPYIAIWFTEPISNTTGDGIYAEEGRFSPVDGVWRRVVNNVEPAFRVIALDAVDTDGDGLLDADELNVYGTDPALPDTDGDGLQDGTEVALAAEGECHDPLNPDSDFDGLLDGEETLLGTDPCAVDTDGDGLDDFLDPNPLDADPTGDLQEATVALADMIDAAPLGVFVGFSNNMRLALRNVLAVQVRFAALAYGFDPQNIVSQLLLESVLARLDGQPFPPDWMIASPQRDDIRDLLEAILDAAN